jgi:PAS domain S-box-containing protein
MDNNELKAKKNQGADNLRRLAEKTLKETADDTDDLSEKSSEDIASLIHELRVHQIELKMQNEELRRTQGELEKTRNRYSHLYDFSPVGYFSVSEKGIITAANLTIASMVGVVRGALIGKPLTHYVLNEDQDIYYKHRRRLLETEKPQVCDLRFVKSDGHQFYGRLECVIVKNKEDELKEIRAAVNDITERKTAEEALREKTNFLDKIIESSAVSTWISDEKGTAIRANPACLKFFGATEDEVIGKYNIFKDAVIENSGFMPDIREVFGKGRPANMVIDYDFGAVDHVDVKNATHKIINSILTPIIDGNGKVTNAIVQTIDLTDIKRMERELNQAQKLESIGNLAGGIAHDFNNILSSIIGFTELSLDEVKKGSNLEDNLQEIYTAGKRAKELVSQILAFARQTNEKVKPVDMGEIVRETLKLIRSSVPADIEIRKMINSDSPVIGNWTLLQQVLMNLAANAVDAMEANGGILELTVSDVVVDQFFAKNHNLLGPGDYVKITVSDTGAGIAPETINFIFEPYYTTKETGSGTGLGLASVHGTVKKYGGTVMVESQPGQGSIFTILLPVSQRQEIMAPYQPEVLSRGSEKILLVDDELPIVKMGQRALERLGYKVTARTSSIEALKLFQAKPNEFDLVITDMTMPNLTGEKLAIELLKIRRNIPVILCTGYSKKISDEKASQIGIKAFAEKPMVKSDLAKLVRKVLDDAKG